MFRRFVVTTAAILALGCTAWAAEPTGGSTEDVIRSKSSEAKPEACFGACRVNFRKELGVDLEYLDTIGQQIHQARKAPDPVGLALAAQSLAVAEKVAGKTASVTSAEILETAMQLGLDRGMSQELAALASIVTDDSAKQKLEKQADIARRDEEKERARVAAGEVSRELFGTLQVINHSPHCLRIYMDGRYLGTVHSGLTRGFHVHNHNWHNHFDAYCEDDGELIQHGDYAGHSHFLSWHIDG